MARVQGFRFFEMLEPLGLKTDVATNSLVADAYKFVDENPVNLI